MCTTPAISNELCLNLLVGGYGVTKFSLFGDPVSVVFRRNIEFKSLEPFEGDIFLLGLLLFSTVVSFCITGTATI